jgi:hypothetical protein
MRRLDPLAVIGFVEAVVDDADGVAVSAGSKFAIVDRYRITLRQGPGCRIAGNSRSDNRDPHSSPHPLMCQIRYRQGAESNMKCW